MDFSTSSRYLKKDLLINIGYRNVLTVTTAKLRLR